MIDFSPEMSRSKEMYTVQVRYVNAATTHNEKTTDIITAYNNNRHFINSLFTSISTRCSYSERHWYSYTQDTLHSVILHGPHIQTYIQTSIIMLSDDI